MEAVGAAYSMTVRDNERGASMILRSDILPQKTLRDAIVNSLRGLPGHPARRG